MKKNTFIILSIFLFCYVISDAQIENASVTATYTQVQSSPLIVGGQTVGIKLYSEGVVCVGFADINGRCPAKEAGIKEGDIIFTVNGKTVIDNETLAVAIAQNKEKIEVAYERKGTMKKTTVCPVADSDGSAKIGLWIRDSVAGVGTVTFYDKKNNTLVTLGHAVTDADTGQTFKIREGVITNCDIVSVKKGEKGTAGEICGRFPSDETVVAQLEENADCGLFADVEDAQLLGSTEIFPARTYEVESGKAHILSDIEGTVKAYEIEIEKVMLRDVSNSHDMLIKVTDKHLLELTGGIVQGMSGSPIIQNGKLVGAVTHVFINEPERGYGIYIGKMLKETE